MHCGTIWVHGRSLRVPVTEDEPRTAYGEYGTGKAEIVAQAFELALSRPAAIGNSFHVAAEQAMTQRGLAAGVSRWFGREPGGQPFPSRYPAVDRGLPARPGRGRSRPWAGPQGRRRR